MPFQQNARDCNYYKLWLETNAHSKRDCNTAKSEDDPPHMQTFLFIRVNHAKNCARSDKIKKEFLPEQSGDKKPRKLHWPQKLQFVKAHHQLIQKDYLLITSTKSFTNLIVFDPKALSIRLYNPPNYFRKLWKLIKLNWFSLKMLRNKITIMLGNQTILKSN